MESLGVAVLGLGTMGTIHAENLFARIPGAHLVGVADPRAERREPWEAMGIPGYAHYEECVADERVDAFVVASTSTSHAELLTACLTRRHVPVFCEKPLALTWEEAEGIHRLVENSGVSFQMGFMRRYDPAYREAFRVVADGRIGRPYHFHSVSRDPQAPPLEVVRHSGGFFADTGVHDFDLARWFLADDIKSVYARGGLFVSEYLREIADIDQAHVSFETEAGSLGVVELSRNAMYGYDVRTEILGTRGAIQIAPVSRTASVVLVDGRTERDTFPGYRERFADAYREEMVDFVRTVAKGAVPSVTSKDGLYAMAAAVAARESLMTGKPVAVKCETPRIPAGER